MSTVALQGLLEYLYGTLTPKDMCWVADHLIKHANQATGRPVAYTEAEAKMLTLKRGRDIKAQRTKLIPHDEVMQEIEQTLATYEN